MLISFDYICLDKDCPEYNKHHERLHKKDEQQICQGCGKTLTRMPCAPKSAHVSWSTWRI